MILPSTPDFLAAVAERIQFFLSNQRRTLEFPLQSKPGVFILAQVVERQQIPAGYRVTRNAGNELSDGVDVIDPGSLPGDQRGAHPQLKTCLLLFFPQHHFAEGIQDDIQRSAGIFLVFFGIHFFQIE